MKKYFSFIYPIILLIPSFGVYFTFYGSPQVLIWDENYHIPSAQKHIDGVMYMEPHPPLGKMLMALGEITFGGNEGVDKSEFNSTDYIEDKQVPKDMHYTGFRWPSVVLMATAVLFFYGIVKNITQRGWLAAAFTSLVIFDNALVIQTRAAMLEGIQLFFILAALYYFVRTITRATRYQQNISWKNYAILGVFIGLAFSVKVNAAILLLLFVALFGVDQAQAMQRFQWLALLKRLAITIPAGTLPIAAIFFSVFYIHIGMGKTIVAERTYKASPEYINLIRNDKTWSFSAFQLGMRDNWRYMSEYAPGVPRLDECKPDERGSFAMDWPLGKKTISFRWNKETINGVEITHYRYLVGNPMVWLPVMVGILLSVVLVVGRFMYKTPIKDKPLFMWIAVFTGLYLAYMIAMLQIERVMYLYHYLIPLVFGAINLAVLFAYIFCDEIASNNKHTFINVSIFVCLVVGVFAFFSPFTYGLGMTESEFSLRNWFNVWQLQAAN